MTFQDKFLILICLVLSISCQSDESIPDVTNIVTVKGKAEKGPFVAGSDVNISDLDADLKPTGRTYNSTIVDDYGNFKVDDVGLSSDFVEIRVSGLYYHELRGGVSQNEITLKSLAKVDDGAITNVNLLTHIEDSRVRNLIDNGSTFEEAKAQSFAELRVAFGQPEDVKRNSSELDLFSENGASDFLFAASAIIVGLNSEFSAEIHAAWLSLLIDLEVDFGDNGVIDNTELQQKLYFSAQIILQRAGQIRSALESTFDITGGGFTIPNFESIIEDFITSSPIGQQEGPLLPESVSGGLNVLAMPNGTIMSTNDSHVIAIDLPSNGEVSVFASFSASPAGSQGYAEFSDNQYLTVSSSKTVIAFLDIPIDENVNSIVIPVSFEGSGSLKVGLNISFQGIPLTSLEFQNYWVEPYDRNAIEILHKTDESIDGVFISENLTSSGESLEKPTYIVYDNLVSVAGQISIKANSNLVGVSFPVLETVSELIDFSDNPRLEEVVFAQMTDCEEIRIYRNYTLEKLHAPVAQNIGSLTIYGLSLNDLNINGNSYGDDWSWIEKYNVCEFTGGDYNCDTN